MSTTQPGRLLNRLLITGATGAIGQALVRAYATPGTHFCLQGRNSVVLEQLAAELATLGCSAELAVVDLTDATALTHWCRQLAAQHFDLVILNHGVNINHGEPVSGVQPGEQWPEVQQLLRLNVEASLALVHAVLPAMRERRTGQIALMSSLAAWYGLPVTPSYSASKAALKAYGEGMRGWLKTQGVKVNVVMPGYVDSAMSRGMPGPKPWLWTPERAAAYIRRGLSANKARISFPFPLNLGCFLLGFSRPWLAERILGWLNYRG